MLDMNLPHPPDRRIRELTISPGQLVEMLKEVPPDRVYITRGMPDDAKCVGVMISRGGRVTLQIESEAFPPRPYDEQYPELDLQTTEITYPPGIRDLLVALGEKTDGV